MTSGIATPASNRDSLRPSVFNVCLELGALDENSLVAEWMFNDPSSDGTNVDDDRRTIRQESISLGWEDTGMVHDERRHVPFSVRASEFAARLRPKGRHRQKPNELATDGYTSHNFGGHFSLNHRTFFERTTRRFDTTTHQDELEVLPPSNSAQISSNSKSFFRLKTRSATGTQNTRTEQPEIPLPNLRNSPVPAFDAGPQASSSRISPPVQFPSDLDGDDDWEEVDVRPQSPLYALKNKGINPAPAILTKKKRSGARAKTDQDIEPTAPHHGFSFSLPRSIFLPSPSPRRKSAQRSTTLFSVSKSRPSRQKLAVRTKSLHSRGFSTSLPSSPFLLVSSRDGSGDPDALSTSVVLSPPNASSAPSVFPVSISKTHRTSMGYHNQFFPDTPSKRSHPKAASYPSLPKAISSQQGHQIPFPRMP